MRPIHIYKVLVPLALLAACDNAGIESLGPGGGGDGGGSYTVDGFVPKPCVPACVPPKVCSKAGVCIEPGTCWHDEDCTNGEVCDPVTKRCVPGDQCGAQEIQVSAVAPNLLVALDRSCSMKTLVTTQTKWQIAVAALDKLLGKYKGMVRFGLTLFPDTTGEKCTQDAIPFPVASGNETKITSTLNAALAKTDPNYPDGPCVTNIDTAMQQAATDPALADTSRPSFVLLITDGKQAGCSVGGGDAGTTQTIKDLLKKKVPTFVVGFGSGVDPAQLNIFADAGGKPTGDPTTHYYKAEDQAELDKALASIAGKAFGCVLKLQQVPPTLDKIYVYFDNKEVAQDTSHTNGWDYDPKTNQLTFYGQACKSLEDGNVKDVDIVYGCKKTNTYDDAGVPGCAPGVTPCTTTDDCPQQHACVAGCCIPVVD